MRQITIEATQAFYNWVNYNKSNTKITFENNKSKMFLHWNLIAEYNFTLAKLWISTAWWYTNTTKERLNWLLNDYKIKQLKGEWFLVNWDEKISFKKWEVNEKLFIF